MNSKSKPPKVLILDIETSQLEVRTFGIRDQFIAPSQIKKDWHIMSWAAKWLGEKKVHYMDQRNAKNIEDDKKLLEGVWKLIDEADILITQNGVSFDAKKLNARFVINGMRPPSPVQHIDTLKLAKKSFAFTSNKLEYMTEKLNKKFKKLKHKKFPGESLWVECSAGNKAAWDEMKIYNIHDVLSTEELYTILAPWGVPVSFSIYRDVDICSCGSKNIIRNGVRTAKFGKFARYRCNDCGAHFQGKENLINNKNLLKPA